MVLSYLQGHMWQRGGESHQSHSMIQGLLQSLPECQGPEDFGCIAVKFT